MEIELEPSSQRFDHLDDRWVTQVSLLVADLQRDVGRTSRGAEPEAGTKGGLLGPIVVDLEPVILALGSAGAFTALADVVRGFLARDQSRSIRARLKDGDQVREIEIHGSNDVDEVARLVAALQEATDPTT